MAHYGFDLALLSRRPRRVRWSYLENWGPGQRWSCMGRGTERATVLVRIQRLGRQAYPSILLLRRAYHSSLLHDLRYRDAFLKPAGGARPSWIHSQGRWTWYWSKNASLGQNSSQLAHPRQVKLRKTFRIVRVEKAIRRYCRSKSLIIKRQTDTI